MISIDPKIFSFAKKQHKRGLGDYVNRTINNLSLSDTNQKILNSFLLNNTEKILIGDMSQLMTLNGQLNDLINEKDLLKKDLSKVFNYKSIRDREDHLYNIYRLSQNLKIEICPYCNRNYTTSHHYKIKANNNERIKYIFPAFDHFKSQKDYPLLALSFYNLLPTCSICNSNIKNSIEVALRHPYNQDYITNYYHFDFIANDYDTLIGKDENLEIEIKFKEGISEMNKKEIENTLFFFNTKDTYEMNHKSLIKDIINKKLTYSDKYLEELQNTYGIKFEDAYKILFETHFEDEKLHKNPFSKIKKDIYSKLDNIKNKNT